MAKGRYTEWITPEGLERLSDLWYSGYSDQDVADEIGIAAGTLYEWMNRFPEIVEAKKRGKPHNKARVKKAFYARTEASTYEEKKVEQIIKDGVVIEERVTTYTKVLPPSDALIIFALKNLFPNEFRDKPISTDDKSIDKHNALIKAIKDAVNSD